ncbi:MAG TPA: hypothetical protein VKR06_00860 [Ktedonosporobacter sp.]|nr:hypothetical protein [Ktedonosporobacter sp.]
MMTQDVLDVSPALQDTVLYQPSSIEQSGLVSPTTPQVSRGLRLRIDGLLICLTNLT